MSVQILAAINRFAMPPTTDIFAELKWRGLIYQSTSEDELPKLLNSTCQTVYSGFDPTSDSLHVGSLLPLLLLRRFQKAGHRPIAVVGGATGMIGDPSGKNKERNLLSVEQLAKNVAGIKAQAEHVLDFDCGENSAILVNNFEWMNTFSFIDFLRDVGKNFPVNAMMAKDSVKGRLNRDDAGLSYTEFSYMLLQAYDFVHLSREFGCTIQVGGSDQWGNITTGIDLGRRMLSTQLYGMTCPLLTKSDGTKMGKTESGAVWLSPEKTSPYDFYQYWINTADDDAGKCLRFLTELDHEEIQTLDQSRIDRPQDRLSQKRLADNLTARIHGDSGLQQATEMTKRFFEGDINQMSESDILKKYESAPCTELSRNVLDADVKLIDSFVESGLSKSKGEARRTIEQGGAYINEERCRDLDRVLSTEDLIGNALVILRSGKKRHAILRFK